MRIRSVAFVLVAMGLGTAPVQAAPPCDDDIIQAVVVQTALEDYGFRYNGTDGAFYFRKRKVDAATIDSILAPSLSEIHEKRFDQAKDKLSCAAEFVVHFDGTQVASLAGEGAAGLTAEIVQSLVRRGLVPGQTHRSVINYTIQYSARDGISVMVGE